MDQKTFASLGGKARLIKMTPEERQAVSAKGGNATKQKYGADYYKNIRRGIKPSQVETTK